MISHHIQMCEQCVYGKFFHFSVQNIKEKLFAFCRGDSNEQFCWLLHESMYVFFFFRGLGMRFYFCDSNPFLPLHFMIYVYIYIYSHTARRSKCSSRGIIIVSACLGQFCVPSSELQSTLFMEIYESEQLWRYGYVCLDVDEKKLYFRFQTIFFVLLLFYGFSYRIHSSVFAHPLRWNFLFFPSLSLGEMK